LTGLDRFEEGIAEKEEEFRELIGFLDLDGTEVVEVG